MAIYLPENLKFVREKKALSQSDAASLLGLGRSTYANYESGATFPKFDILQKIVLKIGISADDLLFTDLSKTHLIENLEDKKGTKKTHLITHPSTHLIGEKEEKSTQNAVLGMQKYNVFDFETAAAAGTAITLLSEDKYKANPTLYMPWLGSGIHVRTRVAGDSMHSTIKDGDYAVSTLITEVQDIRQGYIYMFMDKHDGICYKRLYLVGKNHFELVSDNEIYKPYKRHFNDICAIFQVREVHTTDLRPYWNDLRSEMREMSNKIREIQRYLKL